MKLKAFTITEMLVVMIISGIILLSAFEGITLLTQFTGRITARFMSNMSTFDNFRLLESLFLRSDSLYRDTDNFIFYAQGASVARMIQPDSLLVVTTAHSSDTLFRQVSRLRTGSQTGSANRIDSLFVTLNLSGKPLTLCFTTPPSPRDVISELENNEQLIMNN